MEGSGTLNQHAVTFRLKGEALPSAAPDKPYAFEFDERSSGTHFTAHGSLPRPFDVGLVDAEFDASGADLHDLYYLVGVSLPNTGAFHLQGRMVRRGSETLFDDLKVVSGQSDVQGRVSLDTQKSGRTLVHADLSSALLRLADVGLRVNEVSHLDLADVKWDLGRFGKLHVRMGKGARGSGPRERMVPLINDAGAVLRWFIDVSTQRRYEIVDRQLFPDGFVQQHILHATGHDGGLIALRVCIVIKLGLSASNQALISRIDEYFDPAELAPLMS